MDHQHFIAYLSIMARDEVDLSLIVDGPQKWKLAAHITSEDNVSADKIRSAKKLWHTGIGSLHERLL